MQLKTIFNRVTEYKPFVVEHVELVEHESQSTIEITMRARENGLPSCSVCGERSQWLRHATDASSFRLRSAVDDSGRVGVYDASRELPDRVASRLSGFHGRKAKVR